MEDATNGGVSGLNIAFRIRGESATTRFHPVHKQRPKEEETVFLLRVHRSPTPLSLSFTLAPIFTRALLSLRYSFHTIPKQWEELECHSWEFKKGLPEFGGEKK